MRNFGDLREKITFVSAVFRAVRRDAFEKVVVPAVDKLMHADCVKIINLHRLTQGVSTFSNVVRPS